MRVRWGNVARVVCLAAAAVLIAVGPPEGRAPPSPARPVTLPRLADVPRLLRPRPRERRAVKGEESGGRGGPPSISGPYVRKVSKVPAQARPTPPSPPPEPVGQAP